MDEDEDEYEEQLRIDEGIFEGHGYWFPGTIISARGNGTYDIEYDDGGKEYGVRKS